MAVPIPPQVRQWEAEARALEAERIDAEKRAKEERIQSEKREALEAFLKETSSPFFFDLEEGQSGYCIPWIVHLSEGYYFIRRDYKLHPRCEGTASTKLTRKGNRLLIEIPYDDEHHVDRVVWTSVPKNVVKCFRTGW